MWQQARFPKGCWDPCKGHGSRRAFESRLLFVHGRCTTLLPAPSLFPLSPFLPPHSPFSLVLPSFVRRPGRSGSHPPDDLSHVLDRWMKAIFGPSLFGCPIPRCAAHPSSRSRLNCPHPLRLHPASLASRDIANKRE